MIIIDGSEGEGGGQVVRNADPFDLDVDIREDHALVRATLDLRRNAPGPLVRAIRSSAASTSASVSVPRSGNSTRTYRPWVPFAALPASSFGRPFSIARERNGRAGIRNRVPTFCG